MDVSLNILSINWICINLKNEAWFNVFNFWIKFKPQLTLKLKQEKKIQSLVIINKNV